MCCQGITLPLQTPLALRWLMWATHVTYQPIHPVHWDKRDLEIGLWNAIWWIWQRRILFSQIVTLRLLVCITDSEVLTNWSNKSDKSTDLSGPMKIRLQMNWIWQGRMLSVIKISNNRPNKVIDQTHIMCLCVWDKDKYKDNTQDKDNDKYRSCVVRGWPCGQSVWAYKLLDPPQDAYCQLSNDHLLYCQMPTPAILSWEFKVDLGDHLPYCQMQHLLFCHENSVFKVDLGVPVQGLSELSNDHLKQPTDFKFRSGLCTG